MFESFTQGFERSEFGKMSAKRAMRHCRAARRDHSFGQSAARFSTSRTNAAQLAVNSTEWHGVPTCASLM